jgi:putative membrane protein
MKKVLPFVLIFLLLLSSGVPVSAGNIPSSKEEVVYGLLNLDGSVHNLYVVNIFNGGEITDYGNYSDIRNMTTSEKLNQNGEQITINTAADKFYYQGTLERKELPWDIAIKYFLNGKETSGSELGGKSGALKITVSVKQNNNISSTFFNNYALQIALSLDNKLCSNIKADNATIAEAGSKKQLTYTVLPGNGIDIAVTADVHDFEMEPITINGIKLSLDIDIDSSKFTGQISELVDAIKELDDGAGELLDALNQLACGMQKYTDGMKTFKDGLGQLSIGADKLNLGAASLKNGLSELAKQNDSILSGALAIQQATFDSVNAQLSGMGLGLPVLTPENYSTVLSPIPNLAAVKKQLDGVVQFTQGLKSYVDGVSQLDNGASDLANGALEFKSSSSAIAASANELYNAGAELNAAIKKFRDGLSSYKAGTNELKKGTSHMESEIDNKIDEILKGFSGSGDKIISFVSDKNTNVSAVQFVLKTEPINLPEIQEPAVPKPAKLTFWQKLLKLFGLYNA